MQEKNISYILKFSFIGLTMANNTGRPIYWSRCSADPTIEHSLVDMYFQTTADDLPKGKKVFTFLFLIFIAYLS